MTRRSPVQLRIAQALQLAPMTTSELARALALPRPTAHRALADHGAGLWGGGAPSRLGATLAAPWWPAGAALGVGAAWRAADTGIVSLKRHRRAQRGGEFALY